MPLCWRKLNIAAGQLRQPLLKLFENMMALKCQRLCPHRANGCDDQTLSADLNRLSIHSHCAPYNIWPGGEQLLKQLLLSPSGMAIEGFDQLNKGR